ncbi:MAG: ABC transporter ATP-binding protein [Bacteroidia bacterium]
MAFPDPDAINNSYPHQLSGGQKQRVFIAMATAANPALLIADEPTTALDVTVQAKVISLLKNLGSASGMSTLLISHDLALVSDIADRVLVMRHGEIIESGTTSEIFRKPQKAYTKGLLLCRPPSDKRFERLPVLSDFESGTAHLPKIENPADRQERLQKMYAQEPVLKAENIVAAYKANSGRLFRSEKKIVIPGLNLQLFPGETLGLAGESGSGKTTLGKILAGLLPADSGSIHFHNLEISGRKSNTASPVQMVFQDPSSSFNPTLTMLEALMEPLRALMKGHTDKEKIKLIQVMLEQVQIPASALRKLPAEFSGGQIQRLAIARALLMQPKCVVFDESVSSLDVSVQAGILNLINKLKNQMKLSCVFISHDLSVVRYMSDRVLIMKDGQIVEEGEADTVFTNPSHAYTRELIDAIPQVSISN